MLCKRFIGGEHADAGTWAAHAGARWAKAVVGIVNAPEDPRTISEWGQAIGAGEGTLRNWCHTAKLSPKRSLSLARLLRALYLSRSRQWQPEQLLNVVDRRTLNRMLEQGGLDGTTSPTIDGFLRATDVDCRSDRRQRTSEGPAEHRRARVASGRRIAFECSYRRPHVSLCTRADVCGAAHCSNPRQPRKYVGLAGVDSL